MLGSYEKPVTGMSVAEKWREVGRRVEDGEAFSWAVRDVFGGSADDAVGTDEWFGVAGATGGIGYEGTMSILAYFLALEAEDAATQDAEPYPPTADVVAEEEPYDYKSLYDNMGLIDDGPMKPGTFDGVERRKSWNAKLADGLRKWAHWLEERF